MSLDALAPDQRAVVQLVLQQDRSYEELAGLLGISSDAVRERAHRGLERLAPTQGLDPSDVGELADYLLGQQSVTRREATRSLLAGSAPARAWARSVAEELRGVARSPLPEIPAETAAQRKRAPEPVVEAEPVAEPGPAPARPVRARPRPRPGAAAAAVPGATAPAAAAEEPEAAPAEEPTEERPRRRPAPTGDRPRSNLLGGALLIGGLAIVLVALVVWLVSRGGDDDPGTRADNPTPTPTATATVQPIGQLDLRPPDGGEARGQMVLFATADGIAFTVQGTDLPESGEGEAYAVWLVGGELNRPRRLGYAPPVEANGNFGTSGPREQDAQRFPTWFSQAAQVVVSRETAEDSTQPGPIVLAGDVPRDAGAGGGG